MGNAQVDQLLKEGIAATRAGQKERARELLLQVIALDEEREAAWLWLSGVVDDPEEQQICLENVLALNPDNAAARTGLRWLAEQGLIPSASPGTPLPAQALAVLTPVPPESGSPQPPGPLQAPPSTLEIDPYGCSYCGGSVSGEDPRCDHCRQPVAVRYRKQSGGAWLGWVVVFFALQGAVAFAEGFFVYQLVQMGQLPEWVSRSAARFLIGTAILSPGGLPGDLAGFAHVVALVDAVLAVLCLIAALGLALRSRAVYFGSFILAGLLVMATGAGLLTQLTALLPALCRLGLVAISVRWLVDSAPAFEWNTRSYNADVDPDLRTDLDYYNRGLRYRDMGMWAKAAAHWQVATQLAPAQVKYHAALANAYLKMGYPAVAVSRAETALGLAPDDRELRAFRDSIAHLSPGTGSPLPQGEP
jgi:tetratricopeptide (TPR) repeat protein